MKVGFISDGSQSIGMGHIIRCLSLADEFRTSGCEVMFISSKEQGIDKIKESGFMVEVVKDIGSIECINAALKTQMDLIVIDSYNVDIDYFKSIKGLAKRIAYIDDLNKFTYPVDILINGNINGSSMGYERYSEEQLQLLGTDYNLIRQEFKGLPQRRVVNDVRNIMITTGGSDSYGLTPLFIKWIKGSAKYGKIKLHIILGNAFENKETIKLLGSSDVIVHENVRKMSEIMQICDIAISASGSTLYELSACGTPTIAFIMAENQMGIGRKFAEEEYIVQLGWYEDITREMFLGQLDTLSREYELRVEMSERMKKLVDGNGCKRVVEAIIGRNK